MTFDKIKYFYETEGLSAREVGQRVGMTTWQVIRLMKKQKLCRRSAAETLRIQFNNKPRSFALKENMSSWEKTLFYAGLMLYWGEGSKTYNGVVGFANSNEQMVLVYLAMLRKIYQIREHKLRVLLYCHANQHVGKLVSYWSSILDIPESQFIKPYVRADYHYGKTHKMPNGMVHIRYNDKRLFLQILGDIDIIAHTLLKR